MLVPITSDVVQSHKIALMLHRNVLPPSCHWKMITKTRAARPSWNPSVSTRLHIVTTHRSVHRYRNKKSPIQNSQWDKLLAITFGLLAATVTDSNKLIWDYMARTSSFPTLLLLHKSLSAQPTCSFHSERLTVFSYLMYFMNYDVLY